MKKPLYHSYGSAYSLRFVGLALRQLFVSTPRVKASVEQLKALLGSTFASEAVILTYKARHAIELCLQHAAISENKLVFTQAFSCHALEAAIVRAGATPIYVDTAADHTNMTTTELSAAAEKYGKPAAVIVQHSLGVPANIKSIRQWCNQYDCILIEDLAQVFGGTDQVGNLLGTSADYVVCSFGRDKILDAVTGGALVIPHQKQIDNKLQTLEQQLRSVPAANVIKALLFPALMWFVRKTTPLLIGKVVFKILKLLNLISSPITTDIQPPAQFPDRLATLVLDRLNDLDQQLRHRRAIASLYFDNLPASLIVAPRTMENQATWLRFPIAVNDPMQLVSYLRQQAIHLSDRWYRSPVDSGSLKLDSVYQPGACTHAKQHSDKIFNLPTHPGITTTDAQRIVQAINHYHES